eukprot:28146-Chlamydomonas_euryale.AAC.1
MHPTCSRNSLGAWHQAVAHAARRRRKAIFRPRRHRRLKRPAGTAVRQRVQPERLQVDWVAARHQAGAMGAHGLLVFGRNAEARLRAAEQQRASQHQRMQASAPAHASLSASACTPQSQ